MAVFRAREFRVLERRAADWEIVEAGFHPVSTLPEGTTRATRTRLAEMLDGQALSADW